MKFRYRDELISRRCLLGRSLLGWSLLPRRGFFFGQVFWVDLGFLPSQQERALRIGGQCPREAERIALLNAAGFRLALNLDLHVRARSRFHFFLSRIGVHGRWAVDFNRNGIA